MTKPQDATGPVVLLLGGFLTSPILYRLLAGHLRRQGAAAVVVAPIWTPDWLLVPAIGSHRLAVRAGRALIRAGDVAAELPGPRRPVMVVGHSAGGLLARILTSPVPFAGRRFGASGRIGAIVTLGSPHRISPSTRYGRPLAILGTRFANEHVPGAMFAPLCGYVAVAGAGVTGRSDGGFRERSALRGYRALIGPGAPEPIEGDGIVPVTSALLPGARQVVLPDVAHGQLAGKPWYGSEAVVAQWWPVALDAWRDALAARADRHR
jgi:hypothetical protein